MSSKLSVEEVLASLEQRVSFHREQKAFHAQQAAFHREEEALHAAELEKVAQSLESFRISAASALDFARPVVAAAPPVTTLPAEDSLPLSGRKMVGLLIRRVVESPGLAEPFGPTAVAEEANRRFADRLHEPVSPRTASDTLRQMRAEGSVKLVRKGKAFHEALYARAFPAAANGD